MDLLATQFELNSSRNTFLGLSQYTACLTAGCLPERNQWRDSLMNFYARISLCRTVNRSLDYVSCLSRVRKYGFGQNDSASSRITRLLTMANHLCDMIYYPAECLAWLCEANVFGPNRSSRSFRLLATLCWLANIIISAIGTTLKLIRLRKLLKTEQNRREKSDERRSSMISDMYKCLLTLVSNFCFLLNCVHWLAIPGFLWSGKLPVFFVGLCGTLATLCNIVKMVI